MPVSKEQVLATAYLCRIDLTLSPSPEASAEAPEERLARMASQLDAIVGYMDILNQVDTENVEPLYSPMRDIAPPRPDVARKLRTTDEILANAPERRGTFFVVPPVI